MSIRKFCPSPRKGFTLTEIAIVLGVIGIILGGVWMAAGQVNEKARVTQAMNAFGAITQNMTSLLQGGYGVSPTIAAGTDLTANMLPAPTGSGVLPQWVVNGATTTSPWTNTNGMKIWWVAANPRTYRLSIYGVTMQGCIGLVSQVTNCTPGQPSCPTNVVVGGSSGTFTATPPGTAQTTTGGLSTATIQSLCNPGANHNSYGTATASVEFDFTQ